MGANLVRKAALTPLEEEDTCENHSRIMRIIPLAALSTISIQLSVVAECGRLQLISTPQLPYIGALNIGYHNPDFEDSQSSPRWNIRYHNQCLTRGRYGVLQQSCWALNGLTSTFALLVEPPRTPAQHGGPPHADSGHHCTLGKSFSHSVRVFHPIWLFMQGNHIVQPPRFSRIINSGVEDARRVSAPCLTKGGEDILLHGLHLNKNLPDPYQSQTQRR
ncbi:uncharacterized protein LY89DRAFT_401105 [Mollisia scopiformis]|uniref:Uncharacterized protein n=1 Tax=Mollisia scopiformis TaxID=149040 RepID=A0A132B306_MOLSC|nr:uncharacterized protein LY89DRAFT_401105 [Mollisia scopiformis]KUJ06633.1 hypothetical protein LY89DRAFT_401105 [Mollisia scopiformis]